MREYSIGVGSLTLSTRSASAHTSSAVAINSAPAALKSLSAIAEPSPAPAWIKTSWPRRVSSVTPDGLIATRNSLFLVSVGMPMCIHPIVKKVRLRRQDREDTLVEFGNARRKNGRSGQRWGATEGSSAG